MYSSNIREEGLGFGIRGTLAQKSKFRGEWSLTLSHDIQIFNSQIYGGGLNRRIIKINK